MSHSDRHDAWDAGDAYDRYMGRWSRLIAPRFLDWLGAGAGASWVDVGSGTGALSGAIVERCAPRSVVGIEPSAGFVAVARARVSDPRVRFEQGDARTLPLADESADFCVSGLVLNFVPDPKAAMAEAVRVVRPGGTVAFYVWDYPGGGMGMMRAFWNAAIALDPDAADLGEARRFPDCCPEKLAAMAEAAGLVAVSTDAIEVLTVFRDFDDYWQPFTLGAGPAPGYCAKLPAEAREALRARLDADLPRNGAGAIVLTARAWAVRGLTREVHR
jgi:SAM-dependent methyltransferase